VEQWCIAKNGGGYTQAGVAKGLKVPCLFMIAEVNIRCQKNPGGWYTPYTPNTPLGRSDVTEPMVTIRSPFRGYNTALCVELNGEDLSFYSNETESDSLRKYPYDHRHINKAYIKRCYSDKHFSEFYLQDGGKYQLA